MSPKLFIPALMLWGLLIAQGALAAAIQPRPVIAKSAPQTQSPGVGPESSKPSLCAQAWDRQRIRKGSRRQFIDACIRNG